MRQLFHAAGGVRQLTGTLPPVAQAVAQREGAIPFDVVGVELPVYDALYAYCQAKVAARPSSRGTPRPTLSYRRRITEHLQEQE